MVRSTLLLLPLLFLFSCSAVSIAVHSDRSRLQTDATSPTDAGRVRVAVLPFQVKGASFGSEFADSVALALLNTGKFDVVERALLVKILKEQRLNETGLLDASAGSKIGRVLGVRYLVVGEATALHQGGERNLVDTCTIKFLDVESGNNLVIARKRPGTAWNWPWRLKYALLFSLVWDRNDVFIESSRYDDLAENIVNRVESELYRRAF